jgi:D-alanyl-D-alanine carboxypeptidase (penicillin-binding protein 5/6)
MNMKTRRFLPAFLSFVLLLSLSAAPFAAAAGNETSKQVEDPNIQTKAALLVDDTTGAILYQKNIHKELYPASLTKIMTCLLTLKAIDAGKLSLDQKITAPGAAFEGLDPDGSTANIKEGEVLTVRQLLYCMMVVSANEAANILAVTVGGTADKFVTMMNKEAKSLGCKNTHFANPIGLQDEQHYTSAWDLYLITEAGMKYSEFMTVCDTADIVIPATNLSKQRHLYSTNYLICSYRAAGYIYKEAHGVKTGSTSDAGHCLVSTATKHSMKLVSVVLGGESKKLPNGTTRVMSFYETTRLFKWAFGNFSYQTVLTSNDLLGSMPVTLSKRANQVPLHVAEDIQIMMPSNLKPEDLTRTLRFTKKTTEAPVKKGEKLGEVILSHGKTVYATVPLVAYNNVSASKSLVVLHSIKVFFDSTIVRVLCVLAGVLVVALVVWKLTVGRRRYRYGKSVSGPKGYHGKRRRF